MKLSKAIHAFLEDIKISHAKATWIAYESDLNRFRFHVAMDTVLHVTHETIQRWLVASSAEGNSMATLHRKLATMRAFGRWGVRHGMWLQNPADRVEQVRRPKYLPRPFSDAEVNAIWALDLNPREALVRHLLFYTGLRVSPVCALKVGDVSFSPATIRAWVKGAKHQVVQMHPELVEPLRLFIRDHTDQKAHTILLAQPGFLNPQRRVIERMTRRWGVRAGVSLCLPHRFRHTFATQLIRSGVNPRVVKEILGHEDFSSTMVYTLVTESDEATAMARLSWGKRA